MSKFADKIMKKVKEGAVKKIPRWRFVVKRFFIWTSLLVAICLGAFAVSMVLFQFLNLDWDLVPRVARGAGFGFFKLFPYFWLFISLLLFVFVYFDFKNTRKGYRYGGGVIIGGSLVIALILGMVIYFTKAPQRVDDAFMKVPFYKDMHVGREMLWNMPEKGVVAGVIIELDDDKAIILEDMMKHVWNVDIKNAKIGKGLKEKKLFIGEYVKAIGEMKGPGIFEAEEIRFFKSGF
jgi:predicted secreted protein